MNDEYSRNQAPEVNQISEYQPSLDNPEVKETIISTEFDNYEEYTDNEGKQFDSQNAKSKNNRALSSLSVGVVTTIAAVAVGITSWINVGMKANFNEVKLQDGVVSYEVSVENMTEEETLTARMFNGENLLFEQDLVDEDKDGLVYGEINLDGEEINKLLEENSKLSYRLNLSGTVGLDVERKFDSYVLEMTKMESRFDSITGECHCSEDGCFHFNLNYSDDMKMFNDFTAKIEDMYGNSAYCEFTDNPHEEQTIFVGNLKGIEGILTVSFTVNGQTQSVSIDIEM